MGAMTTAILAGTAIAGVGLQAYGQYRAGQQQQEAAEFNADLYSQQARTIDVKKKMTRQEYDRMIAQLAGKSVAAIAASGYDFSGSFLEVMNDSLTQAQLDKQKELYNLEQDKKVALATAEESRRTGRAAYGAGLTSSAATILTEGNEWYMKYGGFATA